MEKDSTGKYRFHKNYEKEIPDFLSDRLDNRHLEDFLDHVQGCSSCQEELSIQFLVYAGMPRLETGETFNLQQELEAYMQAERAKLARRKRLQVTAWLMEAGAAAAVAGMAAAFAIFL